MMIRAADALAEARRVDALAGHADVGADWGTVATRIRDEATDDWDDKVAVERLEDAGARFVRGHGRLDGAGRVRVGDDEYVAARGVVLNTGTEPGVPPIDGLADTPYWTNREVMRVTEAPDSLAVIGGGAIGLELAQAFAQVRGPGDRARGRRPASSPSRSPSRPRSCARRSARDGIDVRTGVKIERVVRTTAASTSSSTARTSTPTSCWWPPAAGPTSPTSASRRVGLDPTRPVAGPRRADAGRGAALGDRRHHRQGRVHPRVDVPERRGRPQPARRGRAVGRLPLRQPGDLHRPRGRRRRAHRAARRATPASTSARGSRSSRSRAAASSTRRATRA